MSQSHLKLRAREYARGYARAYTQTVQFKDLDNFLVGFSLSIDGEGDNTPHQLLKYTLHRRVIYQVIRRTVFEISCFSVF